jgi:23S rRNA G2069 N7-methylase RlmK/C1962 C5-methylase RlmI
VVLVDPPTFATSKEGGAFVVGRDLGRLVVSAAGLLQEQGALFVATNAAAYAPERLVATVCAAVQRAGLSVVAQHYAPQPPDFPLSRAQPAHLKTLWLRLRSAGAA